jgi:hypothetical protein
MTGSLTLTLSGLSAKAIQTINARTNVIADQRKGLRNGLECGINSDAGANDGAAERERF